MDSKTKSLIIMYHEIHRLRNTEGFSIQRIADYLSLNFRTVKKYLDLSETEFDIYMEKERVRPCLLEPYRDYVKDYLSKYEDTPSAVMHDKLKERFPSFPKVDPKTVYNFVMMIRNENGIPKVSCSERQYSAVPDLPPGEQAQVDFGEKKLRTSADIWVKVYFFIMLLCYSRQKFVVFRNTPFTSQSAAEAHEKAFEFFQGIPKEIIYDQDSVFLHRENKGDYIMTDIFDRYQASRPFKVVFCRPGDPESKGKVENTVKYVKQNFLFQRTYINNEILNDQALSWLARTGNAMVHNTTRKVPQEQWALERPFLQSWVPLFSVAKECGHKVLKTNIVKYRGNIYSVPFGTYKNDDSKVFLTESDNTLIIKDENGVTITSHPIPAGVGNNVVNNNHRRNTSIKLDAMRTNLREFFLYNPDIDVFIENINRLYPRYVRDQFSTVLTCAEKCGRQEAEVALEFCVRNSLFSANDFKSIIESLGTNKKRKTSCSNIKPLGDAKAQLIVNIEPEKSNINDYELLFNKNTINEPIYTTN